MEIWYRKENHRGKLSLQAGVVRAIKVLQKRGDPDPEISEWIELLESSTKGNLLDVIVYLLLTFMT